MVRQSLLNYYAKLRFIVMYIFVLVLRTAIPIYGVKNVECCLELYKKFWIKEIASQPQLFIRHRCIHYWKLAGGCSFFQASFVVQGMVFLLHRFKAGCGGRLGSHKWGINRQDVHITMHFYALLLMLYSYFAALLHTIPRCERSYSLQDCLHRERWRNPVLNRFWRYSLLVIHMDFACSQIRGGPCSKSHAKCIVPSGNTCHVMSRTFLRNFLTWAQPFLDTFRYFLHLRSPASVSQCFSDKHHGTQLSVHVGTCTMHLYAFAWFARLQTVSCGNAWRGNSPWVSLQSFNVVLLGLWLQDSRFPLWQLQPNKCTSMRTSKNATNKQANQQKQYIGCESH